MLISKILRPRINSKVLLLAIVAYLIMTFSLIAISGQPGDSPVTDTYAQWEAPSTFPEPDVATIFDYGLPTIDLPAPPYRIIEIDGTEWDPNSNALAQACFFE